MKKEMIDTQPKFIERNVITKYAFATRVGFIPNNPNKINQDSFILSPNLNFRHYFGVCDGHGQNGKDVSHFIKLRLP
jgi:serine/threonine protein phosphatase PrpC